MADDKTAKLRRRFYKTVDVDTDGETFEVRLDGRPVKTPGRADLRLAKRPLADAVAGEWATQGDKIDPTTMPLTQIACTAIDRVAANRTETEELVANYAGTDLVCYRVEQPDTLAERQAAAQ